MISEETNIDFEERSRRNVIHFYREELLKVNEGEKATDHFNERQRKSLVKQGVLTRTYGHGGCRLELTKQTKKIIKKQAQ